MINMHYKLTENHVQCKLLSTMVLTYWVNNFLPRYAITCLHKLFKPA